MEIKRDVYLNKLIRKEKNGLIKVITGVRRCGKSYLLFNLFHNYLIEKGVDEDHICKNIPYVRQPDILCYTKFLKRPKMVSKCI